MSTGDDHDCIWRQRANAMLELVNAALSLSDAPVLREQHSGDFIIISAADIIKLSGLAEKYSQLANNERHP